VQVEVDHQDPAAEAQRALRQNRDGDVVEDAEAAAAIAVGVVEAAPQVDRDTARSARQLRRQQGASRHLALDGEERLLGAVGDREADDRGQGSGPLQAFEVVVVVRRPQLGEARWTRAMKPATDDETGVPQEGENARRALGVEQAARQGMAVARTEDQVDPGPAPQRGEAQQAPPRVADDCGRSIARRRCLRFSRPAASRDAGRAS
jgi:hypothetical protein